MTGLFVWPRQGLASDERYTPRWLFRELGAVFDLDPAAPVTGDDHVPARARYTVADDGLTQPWHGLVWVNPPFSDPGPWVQRWTDHANGLLLFPWSPNATWRHRLLGQVRSVVLLEHIRFDHPTHTGRHVPVAVALTALGDGVPILAKFPAPVGPLELRAHTVGGAS